MKLRTLFACTAAIFLAANLSGKSSVTLPEPVMPHTHPTVGQIVDWEVAHLTILLSLDTSQQASAKTFFTTEETALVTLDAGLESAKTALIKAVEAGSTSDIAASATLIGTASAQEALARGTAEAEFYAVLTADQQKKYSDFLTAGFQLLGK